MPQDQFVNPTLPGGESNNYYNIFSVGCICSDGLTHGFAFCLLNFWECNFVGGQSYEQYFNWKNQQYCGEYNSEWKIALICDEEYDQCYSDICYTKVI